MSDGSDEILAIVEAACTAMGACACCILRFRGVPSGEVDAYRAAASASKDAPPCPCCLGILQLDLDASTAPGPGEGGIEDGASNDASATAAAADARERSDVLVRKDPPAVFARTVSQYTAGIRSGGHVFTSFALEVTMPPALAVRQAATRCHLSQSIAEAKKAGGENEMDPPDAETVVDIAVVPKTTDVKDVLRALLIPALAADGSTGGTKEDETNPNPNPRHDQAANFRFALLFEHELSSTEAAFAYREDANDGGSHGGGGHSGGKRRRERATPAHLKGTVFVPAESPAGMWQNHGGKYNLAERVAGEKFTSAAAFEQNTTFHTSVAVPPTRPSVRATVRMLTWHQPVYVGGRYKKWARGTPQAPWVDSETGATIGVGSVQTSIDAVVTRALRADGSKLNSAGREDMDVRMLGGGRPFILEVHNPRRPNAADSPEACAAMEAALESADAGIVTAVGIHLSSAGAYRSMHEGSEEKEKEYTAICWAEKPLSDEDERKLSNIRDMEISQATPVRVLHRRTSMARPRTIVSVHCTRVPGSPRFFTLRLRTQAGTYIKEFVHGDFGRTRPNVGEMLGCRADIMQLDVTDIDMDFGLNVEDVATEAAGGDEREGKSARVER